MFSQPVGLIAGLLRQPVKPVFLLGAGASVKSGIPLADVMVEQIARWAYCRECGRGFDDPTVMRSDWWPWLQKHAWFDSQISNAEQYSRTVEALLQPRSNRKDFFKTILRPGVPASAGYRILSKLLARRAVGTILTTNFDELIAESAKSELGVHYIEQIRTPDDLKQMFSTQPAYPQVVYLHGSVDHYTDQNIEEETKRLDEKLIEFLPPLLRDRPLVVIGYRGAEPSIMDHLLYEQSVRCNGCGRRCQSA